MKKVHYECLSRSDSFEYGKYTDTELFIKLKNHLERLINWKYRLSLKNKRNRSLDKQIKYLFLAIYIIRKTSESKYL